MSIEADQTHASRARRTLLRNALLTGAAMMAPGTAAIAKDLRPASAASGDLSKGTAQLTLGMVVFYGFQLLDVFGPLDMFGNLDGKVRIVILGERAGMVASSAGPAVAVDHALDAAPHIDILMVPGGMGTRREGGNTAFIASICTGAALLARTGLLDGRRATTNKRAFNWVMTQGPKVEWVKQARWVEDGHVFTSSGVSAGTDMALALIAKLFGPDAAKQAADIAEYRWNADSTNDPFTAAIDTE